jgi:hypothetical protein
MDTVAEERGKIKCFQPSTSAREDSTTSERRKSPRVSAPASCSWRVRAHSHYDRILELLRERGPRGVLSSELYDNPALFGRSPRNRVSEMRRDGFKIQTVHVSSSSVRYILHEPPRAGNPNKANLPDSLPLFAGIER